MRIDTDTTGYTKFTGTTTYVIYVMILQHAVSVLIGPSTLLLFKSIIANDQRLYGYLLIIVLLCYLNWIIPSTRTPYTLAG